jgi:tRNA U34 5-methylaminomethyl-2-thiouridine-forming methyltransferase MnmC
MHQLIKTNDGSLTLYNKVLDETYHSVNGALTESLHVFIKNGLLYRPFEKNEIHILEVGFGTGLNALLTLENKPINQNIYYTAVEPYPLKIDENITYFEHFETAPKKLSALPLMLQNNGNDFTEIEGGFYFSLLTQKIQSLTMADHLLRYSEFNVVFEGFDLVYFDAFAPQKQSEMWELENLSSISKQMSKKSLLTSYCAQGQFKRNLKSLGFNVIGVKGPPGKREMTIALF